MSNLATYLIVSDVDLGQNGLDGYNYYFVDASSDNINITMTTNWLGNGTHFYFLRIDNSANSVTITAPTGYTINNTSSISLGNNYGCECVYNNTNWIAPRYPYI